MPAARDDGEASSRPAAVIGLGNPGRRYARTRHNVGFWLVDELARRSDARLRSERKLGGELGDVWLAGERLRAFKPQTYVNRSGQAVAALAKFFRLPAAALLVVHDDLDLPPGTARLKRGGGHAGHNGLRDIVSHMGADFARLRLGIGHPGAREGVVDYVLGDPGREESRALHEAIGAGIDALETWLARGFERAQQDLNSRPGPGGSADAGS